MQLAVFGENRLFGEVLTAVLERRGHQIVASGASAAEAVDAARDHDVDVIVLDMRFPQWESLEAIEAIVGSADDTDVVVLTEAPDEAATERALAAGARVCVDKRARLDDVVDAIEREEMNGRVATASAHPGGSPSPARFLTPRERQVLEGLAAGDSTDRLAARLGVGGATVRSHVQSVLSKLGVHSRLQAVLFAVEHNLVSMPERLNDERRTA